MLLGFDAHLGVELVPTIAIDICLCLEKAWVKIGTVWKQTAVTDLGDDRKQAV